MKTPTVSRRLASNRGFGLVELAIVIALIALVVAMFACAPDSKKSAEQTKKAVEESARRAVGVGQAAVGVVNAFQELKHGLQLGECSADAILGFMEKLHAIEQMIDATGNGLFGPGKGGTSATGLFGKVPPNLREPVEDLLRTLKDDLKATDPRLMECLDLQLNDPNLDQEKKDRLRKFREFWREAMDALPK
ncbi:MAG: prepilin-type N-terminal cleavage/methylation domain-containing protein [Opitutae bacterium]|nr:prepilin-type N-terminal cleavage/methylation domain-containing protein [Opitutae bacterium]